MSTACRTRPGGQSFASARALAWAFALASTLSASAPAAQPVPEEARAQILAQIKLYEQTQRKGDLDSALAMGISLIPEAERVLGENGPEVLRLRYNIAFGLREAGRYTEALATSEDVVARAARSLGERDALTLRARLNYGSTLYDLARWREAALEYEAIARLAEGPGLVDIWRYAQFERVLTYTRLGRLGEAAAIGEHAVSADVAAGRQDDELGATTMENLAGVYADLGRHDDAIPMQVRATAIFEKMFGPDDYRTLASLGNVVQVYRFAGRSDEALDAGRRLAALAPVSKDAVDRNALIGRLILAELLFDLGRLDEAQRELDTQLPIATRALGERDPHVLDIRLQQAKVAIARGRLAQARALLEPTCATYQAIGDTQEGLPMACSLYLADVEWRLGARREGLSRIASSLNAFEQRATDGLLSDVSRQSLFASRAKYFRRWIEWSIEVGEVDQAFALSERVRSRALLQSIVYRHADDSAAVLPAAASAALADLKAAIAREDEAIARESDAAARAARVAGRDRRYRELQALREKLKGEHPRYAALVDVRPVDRQAAAAALPRDAVAIIYAFGERRLYGFALGANAGVRVVDLGDAAPLDGMTQAWHALVARDSGLSAWHDGKGAWQASALPPGPGWRRESDWRPLARQLGHRLVAPMLRTAGPARNWIVVPDGILAQLPIEAMLVGGRPLIERRTVRYVQSLSVLATLSQRRAAAASNAVLSVGDPDYGAPAVRPAAVASTGAGGAFDASAFLRGMSADPSLARASYGRMGIAWAPLPATRAEVDAVSAAFAGQRPMRLVGSDASELRLQAMNAGRELSAYRFLHFATHGYLSLDAPALSAIVLSQTPATQGPAADGYITAAEWPAYDLASELIVLSGCETGRGRAVEGEGITGLPYALFVAGNRNAVMTLWKVADAPSARFVAAFFGRIAKGEGIASALAATKRSFLADRTTAHPTFWAAFVQYGAD